MTPTRDLQTISDEISAIMRFLIVAAMSGDDEAKTEGTARLHSLQDEYRAALGAIQ